MSLPLYKLNLKSRPKRESKRLHTLFAPIPSI